MKSRIYKIIASTALLAIVCGATIANAETVVRKDRTHRNEMVANTRNEPRVSNEMAKIDESIPEIKEETKCETRQEIKAEVYSEHKENEISTNKHSDFDDFIQDEAKLQFSVYDLDMGCSYMDYQSTLNYRCPEKNQYFGINLVKRRVAGVLDVDYEYILTCTYSLDVHPRVSKKNPAYLEYMVDDKEIDIPLKTQFYSDNYFSAKNMNKIIQSLPKDLTNVKIVVSTREGNKLKVPVTRLAIDQWHTVVDADLKQLKKEYDS